MLANLNKTTGVTYEVGTAYPYTRL